MKVADKQEAMRALGLESLMQVKSNFSQRDIFRGSESKQFELMMGLDEIHDEQSAILADQLQLQDSTAYHRKSGDSAAEHEVFQAARIAKITELCEQLNSLTDKVDKAFFEMDEGTASASMSEAASSRTGGRQHRRGSRSHMSF